MLQTVRVGRYVGRLAPFSAPDREARWAELREQRWGGADAGPGLDVPGGGRTFPAPEPDPCADAERLAIRAEAQEVVDQEWRDFRDDVNALAAIGVPPARAARLVYRARYGADPGPIDPGQIEWLWAL